MRQMTWEDWNPYKGIDASQILTVLVICFFVSVTCQYIEIFRERKMGTSQRKGWGFWIGFTVFYVYTIFCATVFGRVKGRKSEVRTKLLWTLEAALRTGEWSYWYYIVGNILLFIPLGFALMYLLMNRKRKSLQRQNLFWSIIMCLILSVAVEGIQYMTGTGLCEVDDLLHNTLGGAIGGSVCMLLYLNHY